LNAKVILQITLPNIDTIAHAKGRL